MEELLKEMGVEKEQETELKKEKKIPKDKYKGGHKKMASLKQEAKDYIPKQTLNIADLDRVDISFPLVEKTGIDKDGKEFEYKVMVVNEQEYRVPNSVLEEIKKILDLKPEVNFVNVSKSGSGMATRYNVKVVD